MQRLRQIPLDRCQGKQINFLSTQLSFTKSEPTLPQAHISTVLFPLFSLLSEREKQTVVRNHLEMTLGESHGKKTTTPPELKLVSH